MPIEKLNDKQIELLIGSMETVHETAKLGITDILRHLNSAAPIKLKPEDIQKIENWFVKLEELEKDDTYKAGKCLTNIIIENIDRRKGGRPGLMKQLGLI